MQIDASAAMEAFKDYEEKVLRPALAEADRLLAGPEAQGADADSRRSAAAEVLEKARTTALEELERVGSGAAAAGAFAAAAAVLRTRWGLVLLDTTDRTSEAEAALAEGIPALGKNPFQHVTLLQDCFNALGLLWSRREEPRRSLALLQQGEELYKAWQHAAAADDMQALSLQESPADGGAGASQQQRLPAVPEQIARLAKDKYAHTLFYLAQVHGQLDQKEKSARCCAETLACQLELGVSDWAEWAENCGQLAGLHTSLGQIAAAAYLLAVAQAALAKAEASGSSPARSSVEGGRQEVAANLALAQARLCAKRLALSLKARETGEGASQAEEDAVPAGFRFGQLVPPDSQPPLPNNGLAASDEDAKELFNGGMRHLRAALEYYTLDGHVTMHCNAVLEISELYRWLADWERDRHRKCVLHKARAKRVQELLAQLQPRAWPEVVRALQLDVANAYREITEIKFEDGRPHDKVAPGAAIAKRYYEGYVDAFRSNGKLPDSLERKEEEELFITAVFYLARVTSRLDPPVSLGNFRQTEHLREAVDLYRYCAAFIRRNGLEGQQTLAATCEEMAGLIAENVEMMRVSAARASKR